MRRNSCDIIVRIKQYILIYPINISEQVNIIEHVENVTKRNDKKDILLLSTCHDDAVSHNKRDISRLAEMIITKILRVQNSTQIVCNIQIAACKISREEIFTYFEYYLLSSYRKFV